MREFLEQAAKTGAGAIVTVSGLRSVFQSSLELMAQRPDLIGPQVDRQAERLFASLLDSLGRASSEGSSFGEGAVVSFATAVLRSMQGAAPSFAVERGAGDVIPRLLDSVVTGLNAGLEDRQSPATLWLRTGHNANDLISAILLPLAAVPGTLGSDSREVEALIATIALAIGSDEDGLLAPRDWIVVASAAAEEVARNPGRLIKLDTAPAEQPLAVLLMGLLRVAADSWRATGRTGGAVLFGPTLREAMKTTLAFAGDDPARSTTGASAVQALAAQLARWAASSEANGAFKWLAAYRTLLPVVLSSGGTTELTDEMIDRAVKEAQ
jgi:hypothetical protein